MTRRVWLLGLLVVVVAAGAVVWSQRRSPCATPIAYRVGQIDERFGLTRQEVVDALRRAEGVWRRTAGRDLFAENPNASLTINLVYDERQQTTQARDRLRRSLGETHASHAAAGRSYEQWRATYEARARDYRDAHTAYQQRAQAHNDTVQQWSRRGGVTREAHASLEVEGGQLDAERRRLEAERVALENLAATTKAVADKGNAIAQAHNQAATTFNALYGEPRQFHKGEFNGREISVFEFHDERDLLLLLVHELGHALGLGHTDDPAAVMHAMAGGQVLDPLALTEADRTLLRTRCRRL